MLGLAAGVLTAGLVTVAVVEGGDDTGPLAGEEQREAAAPEPDQVPTAEDRAGEGVAADEAAAAAAALEGYPFSEDSLWRTDVSDAPLHERSDAMRAHFVESFADKYGGIASLNAFEYNNSYYVVDADTPTAPVKFHDCQDKGSEPRDWAEEFAAVPIPEDAVPAAGRDAALSIYSPSSDQLWEFWRAEQRDDGWYACWGGRLDDVSDSEGVFEGNWGSTATGIANSAGMVRIADVRAGSIEHAVSIAIPAPATWKSYSWPAQRSDGWSDNPDALPEGIRLRIDPDVDVEALDLHPVAEMIALAGQEYGFVVTDRADTLSVTTESGTPEEVETGTDPWETFLDGTPRYEVLDGIPWHEVEVLPMDYGEPSDES